VQSGEFSEVVGLTLGCRIIHTESTEVWAIRGIHRDGRMTQDFLGELTFISLFDLEQMVVLVNGFIAELPGTKLSLHKDVFWEHVRAMINQLGHDDEGFIGAIGVGGQFQRYDDFGEF